MSGGVCRRQGIIQGPLAAFGHPSPHHHSGIELLKSRRSTHTHTFNSESSLALCKLDREKEYDNKQPYVHSTRNNIWGFLCCLIFSPSLLFSTSPGIMEVFMFKARTPHCNSFPTHTRPFPTFPSCLPLSLQCAFGRVRGVCTSLPVCVCVCAVWRVLVLQKYKAWSMCWNAAPGMDRIIPAYFTSRVPGLELARGPLSPNRWKWAKERRSGESERRRRRREGIEWMEEGKGEGERVSLFSLSAVLKKTSPHNASATVDVPPLIQAHARTICTTGSVIRCACMH